MAGRAFTGVATLTAILVLAVAGAAHGQLPRGRFGLTLVGGGTEYDLAGTGTANVAGLRLEARLLPFLVVEPGVGYFRAHPEGEPVSEVLFPEVSVHLKPIHAAVSPYLGVGAGWASVVSGGSDSEPTLHVTVGLTVRVSRWLDLRGEGRLRSVDPFAGTTADYTGGFTIRP